MLKRIALGLILLCGLLSARTVMASPAEGGAADPHAAGTAAGEEPRKHELVEFDPTNAVWTIIIFVVLLAVLYPTAWKNVLAGLKAREERIRKDIADAEAARQASEGTLRKYEAQLAAAEGRVREMLQQATVDGERLATQIRARAQQEAEDSRERALRDIEAARKQAVIDVYQQAAELSTNIAEKIIRRNLNPQDQQDLVASSLEQLRSVSKN